MNYMDFSIYESQIVKTPNEYNEIFKLSIMYFYANQIDCYSLAIMDCRNSLDPMTERRNPTSFPHPLIIYVRYLCSLS